MDVVEKIAVLVVPPYLKMAIFYEFYANISECEPVGLGS